MTGQLRLMIQYFKQAEHVAARLLAWAGPDADRIGSSTLSPMLHFTIPAVITHNKEPLRLIHRGPDLLQVFDSPDDVQERMWQVASGEVTSITDPARDPTFTRFQVHDQNHLYIELENPTDEPAIVDWGDGSQSVTQNHVYERSGLYLVRAYSPQQIGPASESWILV